MIDAGQRFGQLATEFRVAERQVGMVGANRLGDRPRMRTLIERGSRKADAEGSGGHASPLHQNCEGRRIDAARKKHPDRDIGDQVQAS